MKSSTKWLIGVLLVFIVGFFIFKPNQVEAGVYDDFAKCLTDSGAKMYGAYWCPHCMEQKKMFDSSVDLIPYVECDPRGDNADPEACVAAGIEGYPTWIFSNGEVVSGTRELSELAFRSNCTLPQ